MCPLWLLPARVPDLHLVEGGDGFAPWAHLLDEDGCRRGCDDQRNVGKPFRPLPRLYGLHDGVSFRSRLREADRSNAGANRTPLYSTGRGKAVSRFSFQYFHAPEPAARSGVAVAPVSENRVPDSSALDRHPEIASQAVAGYGGSASAGTRTGNASRVDPGTGGTTSPRWVATRVRPACVFPAG